MLFCTTVWNGYAQVCVCVICVREAGCVVGAASKYHFVIGCHHLLLCIMWRSAVESLSNQINAAMVMRYPLYVPTSSSDVLMPFSMPSTLQLLVLQCWGTTRVQHQTCSSTNTDMLCLISQICYQHCHYGNSTATEVPARAHTDDVSKA